MSFNPSPFQLEAKRVYTTTNFHMLIKAVAGSGKTTTIVWLLSFMQVWKRALFCAFNRDIKEELAKRCAKFQNVSVSTIHGLGMKMLSKEYKSEVLETKYKKIFEEMRPNILFPPEDPEFEKRIMQLVDLLRVFNVKTLTEAAGVAEKYSIATYDNELTYAIKIIEIGRSIVKQIDYTDMLYLPVYHKLSPSFKYDEVFVDECQDLNSCQLALVRMHVKTGGRMIFVGDEKQAIYAFAGADSESFNKIVKLPNLQVVPLSENYRCPRVVIKYLNDTGLNTEIKAWEGAPEGVLNEKGTLDKVQDNDMVLSRFNMPLAKLCMEYLSQGIKAYIRGKDIGASLCALIRKSKKVNMDAVMEWLVLDLERIKRKLMVIHRLPASDIEELSEYVALVDKQDAIRFLTAGCKTADEGIAKIQAIFSDTTKEGIQLSTIHKAKGLEADNVHIVCDWMMPSKFAKKDHEKVQEDNLRYVAYSRPKKSLNFIIDFDPYKKSA